VDTIISSLEHYGGEYWSATTRRTGRISDCAARGNFCGVEKFVEQCCSANQWPKNWPSRRCIPVRLHDRFRSECAGDAPGDLIVPGKERLPTTIISTEGLTITISVGIDLGNFVPNARLETDLTFLLRKLIERIEALNAKSNSAGDRISGLNRLLGRRTQYHWRD